MPKREKPLHLDMGFDEVLRRYAQADPKETADQEKKARSKRKRGERQAPAQPGPSATPPSR